MPMNTGVFGNETLAEAMRRRWPVPQASLDTASDGHLSPPTSPTMAASTSIDVRRLALFAAAAPALIGSLDEETIARAIVGLAVEHLADWCALRRVLGPGRVGRRLVRVAPGLARPTRATADPPLAIELSLEVDDRQLGILTLAALPGGRGGSPDPTLAAEFAQLAARAMDNARQHEQAVTERAERAWSEASLRESEARYRQIAEAAQEGIWLVNAERRTTFVNAKLAQLLGWEAAHMTDSSLFAFLDEQCAALTVPAGSDHEPVRRDVQLRRRDGDALWAIMSSTPVYDDGQFSGTLSMLTDITERKYTEDALQDANRRLAAALADLKMAQDRVVQRERLRALGEMAAGVAHDFNNALTPVLGFAELLLQAPDGKQDAQRLRRYLSLIHAGATDAAGVVLRLREFYRPRQEGDPFLPVDLRRLVEQVVALTRPKWKDQALAAGRQIVINQDLGPVPMIAGSEGELREALTNLIFNAADALPSGGTVDLRVRQVGQKVVLEVADNGVGMPEDVRRRCLEPFFTTKGDGGTGLGLSVVHGIVRRHQGTLEIESVVGRGTLFRLQFPVSTAPQLGASAGAALGEAPPRALRVLVVDDEPQVRALTVAYLSTDGHSVVTAQDGHEGLECFKREHFDLVVTDQAMPGLTGDQLAAAIKHLAPNVPVLLLTGFIGFGDLIAAPASEVAAQVDTTDGTGKRLPGGAPASKASRPPGVDAVLGKPVSLDRLRQTLKALMAGAGQV
jgi:PAS domain S-box-containing protein